MVELISSSINVSRILDAVASRDAGAVLLFLGTTREFTNQRQTLDLCYEAYGEMARRQLEKLEVEARRRWPLTECAIVHRLGIVPVGDSSVAVAVSSPHRAASFEAGRWLIDELKKSVPVWKQERWADGSTEWIHPHEPGGPHDLEEVR